MAFYTKGEKQKLSSLRWEIIKILSQGDMRLDGENFLEWVTAHARQDIDKLRAKRVEVLESCAAFLAGYFESMVYSQFPETLKSYNAEVSCVVDTLVTNILKFCVFLDDDGRKREKTILQMQTQAFEKAAESVRRKSKLGV